MGRYKIGFSFGDLWLKSGLSSRAYGNAVNLLDPFQSGYVDLPEQFDYWPSIFIKHIDCSAKTETIIGSATLVHANRYLIEIDNRDAERSTLRNADSTQCDLGSEHQPLLESGKDPTGAIMKLKTQSQGFINMHRLTRLMKKRLQPLTSKDNPVDSSQRMLSSLSGFTWWTKYYNSIKYSSDYDCTQKHRLCIYDAELEQQAEFGRLRDWSDCVDLHKMPEKCARKMQPRKVYAQMKIDIQVRRCSDSLKCYSLNK